MKFIKGKYKPLHLGKNYPRHQSWLEAAQLESSFAERDPVLLVDTKLNMSQQGALAVKASCWHPRLYEEECCQQAGAGDPAPPLTTSRTHLECWVQLWAPQSMPD